METPCDPGSKAYGTKILAGLFFIYCGKMEKLIYQGAEAKLFLDNGIVVKDRFRKTYRLKEIDDRLRKSRTKREAKVLEKLRTYGIPVPSVISNDEKSVLKMEYIKGFLVRDVLEKEDYKNLCMEIGTKIAKMHNHGIIHGDLTTSNMILKDEIYFIDFGLSFFSNKVEDKAVDLHLVKEALESKHYKIWEECWKEVLSGYRKEAKDNDAVMKRLEAVESRGRYKTRKK